MFRVRRNLIRIQKLIDDRMNQIFEEGDNDLLEDLWTDISAEFDLLLHVEEMKNVEEAFYRFVKDLIIRYLRADEQTANTCKREYVYIRRRLGFSKTNPIIPHTLCPLKYLR